MSGVRESGKEKDKAMTLRKGLVMRAKAKKRDGRERGEE